MKTFNNNCFIKGYVNSIRIFKGDSFEILNLKIAIFNYKKDGKKYYDTIEAQISSRFDKEGNQKLLSNNPLERLNNQHYAYLKDNLKEGMYISINGYLRGVDQIYLNGRWIDFFKLSAEEQEKYVQTKKNELVLRNRVTMYITDYQLPYEKKDENKNEEKQQENTLTEEQADEIEVSNNDPVDDDGIVHEEKNVQEEEKVTVKETTYVEPKRFERNKYFKYADLFAGEIIVDAEFTEEF